MPYAHNGSARVHWSESGTGDPVLLVMGHVYGQDMWHRVIPVLATKYRVITFDNRGVGKTTGPTDDLSIALMAADAAAVMDAAGVTSAHVYGVSMGGLIAQELAFAYPSRVNSLVLGCTGCPENEPPKRQPLGALMYRLPRSLLARLAAKVMYGKATDPGLIREDRAILARTPISPKGIAAQAKAISDFASFRRVPTITVPTLVIHGEDDQVVPYARGVELAQRIPGATLVTIAGAGHNYTTDNAELSNSTVMTFLDGVWEKAAL